MNTKKFYILSIFLFFSQINTMELPKTIIIRSNEGYEFTLAKRFFSLSETLVAMVEETNNQPMTSFNFSEFNTQELQDIINLIIKISKHMHLYEAGNIKIELLQKFNFLSTRAHYDLVKLSKIANFFSIEPLMQIISYYIQSKFDDYNFDAQIREEDDLPWHNLPICIQLAMLDKYLLSQDDPIKSANILLNNVKNLTWYNIPLEIKRLIFSFSVMISLKEDVIKGFKQVVILRQINREASGIISLPIDVKISVIDRLIVSNIKLAKKIFLKLCACESPDPEILNGLLTKLKTKLQLLNKALILSSSVGNLALVKDLISKGEVDIKQVQPKALIAVATKALIAAATNGKKDIVSFLASEGIDMKPLYKRLFKAIKWGEYSIVQNLIQSGLDVNVRNAKGYSTLSDAVYYAQEDITKLLLNAGVLVNDFIKDERKAIEPKSKLYLLLADRQDAETALHITALDNRYFNIAKLLLENGADVLAKDREGKTPLDWAMINGNNKLAKLLKEHGAEEKNSCIIS